MTPAGADLIEAIDQIGATPWSGTAFRFTSPRRDPLSGHGAYLAGGRWNPRESFPCIYLAQPRQACIAEFYRRAEGQARGAPSLLPQVLHTVEVSDLGVLDLTTTEALHEVGLELADIRHDDHSACAEVGEAAHFLGYQAFGHHQQPTPDSSSPPLNATSNAASSSPPTRRNSSCPHARRDTPSNGLETAQPALNLW